MAVRISTAIDTALVTWIKTLFPTVNGKILWDKASMQGSRIADKPLLPYVVLNIIAGPHSHTRADITKASTGDDLWDSTIIKTFTLSITYISNDDYLARIDDLQDSLVNPLVLQQLRDDAGLGVWEIMSPNDVSEQLTTKFEGRGQLDVRFSFAKTDVDLPLGEIRQTIIDTEYDGVPGNQIDVDSDP